MIRKLKVLSGISKIVYHRTYLNNLVKILTQNKFYLSSAESSDVENVLGKGKYYMSTSRTRYSRYQSGNVVLVLDGEKLSQRYRGKSVDYWSGMASDRLTEQEDRIWSDKPEIPNALKYIKRVDIGGLKYAKNNSYLIKIVALCRRKNIPVYIFNDDRQLRLGNIKNATPTLEAIKKLENKRGHDKYENQTPYATKYILQWYDYIIALENYLKKPQTKSFTSLNNSEVNYKHRHSNMDIQSQIGADIHNAKNKNPTTVTLFDKLKRLSSNRGYLLKDLYKYVLDLREKVRKKENEIQLISDLTKNLNYLEALKNKQPESELSKFGFIHRQDPFSLNWIDEIIDSNRETDNKELKSVINKIDKIVHELHSTAYSFAVSILRRDYADSSN